MLELLSLIGAPGAGKIFQIAGDFLSDRKRDQIEDRKQAHVEKMAGREGFKEYITAIHQSDDNEIPSFHSVTMCSLYLMFALTTCVFIGTCLYIQWELGNEAFMVGVKDPEQQQNTWSILGGAVKGSYASRTVTFISPLGVAYLALHPLLFVLGLVSSGRSPFKGTR